MTAHNPMVQTDISDPYIKIAHAVIFDAIKDACGDHLSERSPKYQKKQREQKRKDAIEYITDAAFGIDCEMIGLNKYQIIKILDYVESEG